MFPVNQHEILSLIFSEKKKKIQDYRLLQW